MTDLQNPDQSRPSPSDWLNGAPTPAPAPAPIPQTPFAQPPQQQQQIPPAGYPAAPGYPAPAPGFPPAAAHIPGFGNAAAPQPVADQPGYYQQPQQQPIVAAPLPPSFNPAPAPQPVQPPAAYPMSQPVAAPQVPPGSPTPSSWLSQPTQQPAAAQYTAPASPPAGPPPAPQAEDDSFVDLFEGNSFTDLDERPEAPAFQSTVTPHSDDDDGSDWRSSGESLYDTDPPRSFGPPWLSKLPYAGMALGVIGVGIAFIPTIHALGFWISVVGILASAVGFIPPRNLKLTAIAILVSLVGAFATGLVHTGTTGSGAPTPAAGGPNSVTFTVQGLSGSTDADLQYVVDRSDSWVAVRASGGDLPWTNTVPANARSGTGDDSYTVRAIPKANAKAGLACWITVGDTIVTVSLAKPGENLICRYTGRIDKPVAAGTTQTTKDLLASLKTQAAAG